MRFCVFYNSDYYTHLHLCALVMSSCVLVSQVVIMIYNGFRHSCDSQLTMHPRSCQPHQIAISSLIDSHCQHSANQILQVFCKQL